MADPDDFSGLKAWYKADSESYVNGALVHPIHDRSGGGATFDMNQPDADANKAIFKTSIVNGLPVFRFDGTDDSYRTSGGATWASMADANNKFTAYVYVFLRTLTDGRTIWAQTGNVTARLTIQTGPVMRGTGSDGGGFKDADKAFALNVWILVCVSQDGSNVRCGVDDLSTAAMAATACGNGTPSANEVCIARQAGASCPDMDLAEMCIYNVAHDEATRTSLQQYFNFKYKLTPLLEAQRTLASRHLRLVDRPVPMVTCRRRSLIVVPDMAPALRRAA